MLTVIKVMPPRDNWNQVIRDVQRGQEFRVYSLGECVAVLRAATPEERAMPGPKPFKPE